MKPSKSDIAYAAGIIDGEAWVALQKRGRKKPNSLRPVIVIEMCCEEVLQFMQKTFDAGTIRKGHRAKHSHRPIYKWTVVFNNARRIAAMVLPFSIEKKPALLSLINHPRGKTGRPGKTRMSAPAS